MASGGVVGDSRLGSVDALRGVTVAAMLLVNTPGDWDHVFPPLEHAAWNGATPTDFIFPMFLFVMGASISLAIVPRLERGDAPAALRNAALWRALRIVALGVVINALAAWLLPGRDMRWPGVLQRIGVCFAIAAMLAIHAPWRAWWIAIVVLLAAYTLLLMTGGTLAMWNNVVDRMDTAVFGRYVWDFNQATGQGHDPEGLPSTMTALVTTLLGVCAGAWLRQHRWRAILATAVVLLVLGWASHGWIPFNKNLWTPSFTLWTAGWCALAMLAFHWLIDQRGWPPFGRRFGRNAITAYAGSEVMQVLLVATGLQVACYGPLRDAITPWAGPYVASLAFAILFVVFWWVVVWIMDRRGWYLRI